MNEDWKTQPDVADVIHKIRTISTYLRMSADEIPDDLTDSELAEMVAWSDRLIAVVNEGIDLEALVPGPRVPRQRHR